MASSPLDSVIGIFAAALGGAAVGLERQSSGHASGKGARFAGLRTFTLLGGLAGTAGWLWLQGFALAGSVLIAGGAALVVAAYVAASREEVEGTTEVAALVVLAAGFVAGTGQLAVASAVTAVTVLILVEKSRLHAFAARLDDEEMRAGARFAAMAVVILPLLPVGPYGPLGGVRPRELWALVLFFSGLSFAGYIARRAIGARHGTLAAGLLGGLISSTNVTLTFARLSREGDAQHRMLAAGVLGAGVVMLLRTLLASAVLNYELAIALAPYLVAPFIVGVATVAISLRAKGASGKVIANPSNPLEFRAALQMAVLFQLVLFAISYVRSRWGDMGMLMSGAVLGLTDVDALTISMAKSVTAGFELRTAAQAITTGIFSNTLLKLLLAVAIGQGSFRRLVALGLALMAFAAALSLAVVP